MTNTVVRNDEANRYEITLPEGEIAGFAEFVLADERIKFTHTEVMREHRGEGIGEELADFALRDAVDRGETIVPLCPFIVKYAQENQIPNANILYPS